MRRALLFPSALATAASLAAPAPAHADGTPPGPPPSSRDQANTPATWWVDTRPWTCARWARPLAEEIELACDAGAGCNIAPDERAATRRATLVCGSEERWTLEARDRNGRVLWTLSLDGSHEDRLRQAGVWVARSDMPDLPPLPEDRPPPRASKAPELAELPEPAAEPAAPAPAPAAPPAASDQPPRAPPSASSEQAQKGWFAFSASAQLGELRMSTIVASWNLPVAVGGIAAMGGLHGAAIAHSTHIYGGLSLVYEHSLTDFGGLSASLWRPGAVLGWGAPYGEGWFGVSVGAGVGVLSASQSSTAAWATGGTGTAGVMPSGTQPTKTEPSQHTLLPLFTELALHAKLPVVFGEQPFVSVAAGTIGGGSVFTPGTFLGLDLGVVWND